MSYQEKKTTVSIVTGALVLAAYCIYALSGVFSVTAASNDLKFWATTMLIFIGIGIAASIIIQIIFHIVFSIAIAVKKQISTGECDEKEVERTIEGEMVEDEMNAKMLLRDRSICIAMRIIIDIIFLG